ncbi:MAG: hypothetical protein H0U97_22805 [Gammaproteobacteria bacterium]|nr:hypothetical protein [Gammaproteobacteria bacterium]
MSLCYVVALLFAAGVFGGIVNFALARTEESTWPNAFWSVVIGLGAAFLVPLFLNTISSSLLSGLLDGTATSTDPFVFFGFCLLGAIASKSMIQTLTQKVLREAEEAKSEVKKLKKEVEPIIVKETEPEIVDNEKGGLRGEAYGLVGEEPKKIIRALGNSKYSRRTVQGISKEAGVSREKVIEVLEWLQKNSLGATTGEPSHYWSLTERPKCI